MALYYDGDLEIHFDCYWREPFDGGQTAAQATYWRKKMYEWEVQYSETKTEGTRISCKCWTATVYAEDEDEARAIMAEEEPGKAIDKITRGERVDDDA